MSPSDTGMGELSVVMARTGYTIEFALWAEQRQTMSRRSGFQVARSDCGQCRAAACSNVGHILLRIPGFSVETR
jgi:hypothetical protein